MDTPVYPQFLVQVIQPYEIEVAGEGLPRENIHRGGPVRLEVSAALQEHAADL